MIKLNFDIEYWWFLSTHDQVNASSITKITSWLKFLGKNFHLLCCATVCAKSEVMLGRVCSMTTDQPFIRWYLLVEFILTMEFQNNAGFVQSQNYYLQFTCALLITHKSITFSNWSCLHRLYWHLNDTAALKMKNAVENWKSNFVKPSGSQSFAIFLQYPACEGRFSCFH